MSNLLAMIESRTNAIVAIQNVLREMADLPGNAESAERRIDLSIQQSDLQASSDRLSARITKGINQLTDKDHASAAVLRKAQRDEFLSLRLRARALKHRIRSRIRDRRFESERLVRAYFRAALGMSSSISLVAQTDELSWWKYCRSQGPCTDGRCSETSSTCHQETRSSLQCYMQTATSSPVEIPPAPYEIYSKATGRLRTVCPGRR